MWRAAKTADLDSILRIGAQIHLGLPETRDIIAEKLRLFPEGCFVLVQGETTVGYALSHPWLLNHVPKLNKPLLRLPRNADCLLIHDVAVLQEGRGRDAAKTLVRLVTTLARDLNVSNLALVSVYGSYHLWKRLGFEFVGDGALTDELKTYGDSARYMISKLS